MSTSQRRMVAIMFTDIVGYTAMMEKDEKMALSKVKLHEKSMEQLVSMYNGELSQFYGDGSLSIFNTALEAVECARDLQLSFKGNVPVRIGVHIGEVTQEEGKFYGSAVNVASRIESSGHEGTILFSPMVQDKIKNISALPSKSIGLFQFKNVEKPMELFALQDENLLPIDINSLSNQLTKNKPKYAVSYGLSAIGLIVLAFILVNMLSGASTIPKKVKEERIAVAIYDNQTGDKSLDILGNYLSDDLYRGFSMLDGIKLSSAEVVKDNLDHLGVLPENAEKKASFFELTGARYAVEGSYYTDGKDSIEIRIYVSDKNSGETIYSFDAIKGHKGRKEDLAKAVRNHILGYWASRIDKKNIGVRAPKYDAYEQFLKGNAKFFVDSGAITHYKKAIELDPGFVRPYFHLADVYWHSEEFKRMEAVYAKLDSMSKALSIREKNDLETVRANRSGNFELALHLAYKRLIKDPTSFESNWGTMWLALNANYAQLAIDISKHINDSEINYSNLPRQYQYRLGNLSRAYNKMGHYQKAAELLEKHVPINSFYRNTIWMRIRAYANLGKSRKIEDLASLRRGLPNRTNQHGVYNLAAFEYYLLGNDEMVDKFSDLALYQSEIEFDSIPLGSLFNHYYLRKDYTKAKEVCLQLIDENSQILLFKLAHALTQIHLNDSTLNIQELLAEIDQAGDKISRNNDTHLTTIPYLKAILYAHLGEKEIAMEYITESYQSGVYFTYNRYDWDILLLPLFDYPPFQEFVKPREFRK